MTERSALNKAELLAPAGNTESFYQAVNHGADAVYLGLTEFSARAKAENFTLQNLGAHTRYAHLFGVKVYVALNTLIKDSEMAHAIELAAAAYNEGADALIIQDKGLFKLLKRYYPEIPLHFSTQAGIHNVFGAVEAKRMGAERVILSREVTLNDIEAIKKGPDIDLECFVHGALCVSFSGNCYFSGQVSGYSGNRGKCMQLCRKPYMQNGTGEPKYFLSPYDLCFIDELDALTKRGVTSLKIEGRLKRPEYVASVVSIYRKALDGKGVTETDLRNLSVMYNRGGFSKGHLYNEKDKLIFTGAQGHMGSRIGTVVSVNTDKATVKSDYDLIRGDGVKFFCKDSETGGGECIGKSVVKFSGNVKPGDSAYLTTDSAYIESLRKTFRKIDISIAAKFEAGEYPVIELTACGETVKYTGSEHIEQAKTSQVTTEDIASGLNKTGGTAFTVSSVTVKAGEGIFAAKSTVNSLRRNALALLEDKLLSKFDKEKIASEPLNIVPCMRDIAQDTGKVATVIERAGQLTPSVLGGSDIIIHSPCSYALQEITQAAKLCGDKYHLFLPPVAREGDLKILGSVVVKANISRFVVSNIYGRAFLDSLGIYYTAIDGAMQNIINSYSDSHGLILGYDADRQLGLGEYLVAFGRVSLMTFCHCPDITAGKTCASCSGFIRSYTDDRGNEFVLRKTTIKNCYFSLLNSLPVYNPKLINEKNNVLFDFCGYNDNETAEIFEKLRNKVALQIPSTNGMIGKKLY